MHIATTVAGIYVLDGDEVVDSTTFEPDDLPGALFQDHPIHDEYPDAEPVVLPLDRLVDISGRSRDDLIDRQVAAARDHTRDRIAESGSRDQLLVQAVRALDDLDTMNNEMAERLRPWYRVHFPELGDAVDDHQRFAELVADEPDRDEMDGPVDGTDSTGIPLTARDREMVQRFAAQVRDSHVLRDDLESYVGDLAEEVAPNLAAVCGGVLAARLVSLAGSIEDIAKMPSSTIQVLGAEKAMFRHVKGEGDAPKHGILFMHPTVRNLPDGKRGKMARVLANKAAIAARLDQYGTDFRGDALRAEVDETYEEVRDG